MKIGSTYQLLAIGIFIKKSRAYAIPLTYDYTKKIIM